MRSLLDEFGSCVLQSVRFEDELVLTIAQLHVGQAAKPTLSETDLASLTSAQRVHYDLLTRTRPTFVDSSSARAVVRFASVVAWQVVDESYTTMDEEAQSDSLDTIRVVTKSNYRDYVMANHGWFEAMGDPATLYEVVTMSHIVFVMSRAPPQIQRA